MAIHELLADLGELVEWLRAGTAGWRYLLSRSFREKTYARWRQASRLRIIWDVVCGVAGVAFTLFLVYALASLVAS